MGMVNTSWAHSNNILSGKNLKLRQWGRFVVPSGAATGASEVAG